MPVAAPDMPQSDTVNSSKYDTDEMSLLMLIDDDMMSDSEPVPPKSSEYVINVSETAAAAAVSAGGGGLGGFKSEWHMPKLPIASTMKVPSHSSTIHWGPGVRCARTVLFSLLLKLLFGAEYFCWNCSSIIFCQFSSIFLYSFYSSKFCLVFIDFVSFFITFFSFFMCYVKHLCPCLVRSTTFNE